MGKLRGLGFKMAGNAKVEPVLDLSGQIKDFDSHGKVLCKFRTRRSNGRRAGETPIRGVGVGYSISH
jgi:hypothetical protein